MPQSKLFVVAVFVKLESKIVPKMRSWLRAIFSSGTISWAVALKETISSVKSTYTCTTYIYSNTKLLCFMRMWTCITFVRNSFLTWNEADCTNGYAVKCPNVKTAFLVGFKNFWLIIISVGATYALSLHLASKPETRILIYRCSFVNRLKILQFWLDFTPIVRYNY